MLRVLQGRQPRRLGTVGVGAAEVHQRVEFFDGRQPPIAVAAVVRGVERIGVGLRLGEGQFVVGVDVAIYSEWCATKAPGWEFKLYPYDVSEYEWSEVYLEGNDMRVLWGGSWYLFQGDARCAFRLRLIPGIGSDYDGFRLVSPI